MRRARVSLSHSQRDLVAQEVGVMDQISYSNSVLTFFSKGNKRDTYKGVTAYFISYSFSGKKWLVPPMLDVVLTGNFSQPP